MIVTGFTGAGIDRADRLRHDEAKIRELIAADGARLLKLAGLDPVLDEAAKRIVTFAAPFAPFPPDIRKETDYLDITRTWNFTRGNALETR